MSKYFAAIDLKSFYASVECNERGLDPLTTNLVVADSSRTNKTICLAVSPSLKSYGLPGRARLFAVEQKVAEINHLRKAQTSLGVFLGKSTDNQELLNNPNLELDYLIATPRMQYYLDYSSKIYNIYLRHIAPEDIFAYSIDEVFCDLTSYLKLHHCSAEDFVSQIIQEIKQETGITATAGIGTNLFLAKVAMDILAKHTKPNQVGVRVASLDETSFRQKLWPHTPITDFWRVGRGYTKRLASHDIFTMGDVARCSLEKPELLYQLFGVNAELLIDHSWGYECVEIKDVKNHRPENKSLSSGQVLSCPYNIEKTRTIIKEMSEELTLSLVTKNFLTNHLSLFIEYDSQNSAKTKTTVVDYYGRKVPKPLSTTIRLNFPTSSTKLITDGFIEAFDNKVHPNFTVRKVTLAANELIDASSFTMAKTQPIQANLFINYDDLEHSSELIQRNIIKERHAQNAVLKIRQRYGKNAILRGINFEPGATMRLRHQQIGGHHA